MVTQSVSRDANPRAPSWTYIDEILRRAGLFFQLIPVDRLPLQIAEHNSLVLLAGDLRLSPDQRSQIAAFVKGGGAIIGIGGTSGLDEVFGVRQSSPSAEGWLRVSAPDHPVVSGLRSSLHTFGGVAVGAHSATPLAHFESADKAARGQAILENRFGEGLSLLLAPDLLFSIVHLQQGLPVFQDANAGPDDASLTNEGILKAEDGMVLDWKRDRQPMQPDGVSVFLEPIADELREIVLRSIFYAAVRQRIVVPVLWYWPRGLKAIAHLSHDTDGNDPEKAVALLECVNRCQIKSTWCTLYPGGYPPDFYRRLRDQGFEIAMHYDARTGETHSTWSKENFFLQHEWLRKEAGLERIVSNKNHYTRWEGRLDFFRWCEEIGIRSDQTRGPSKKGTIGFPLGGSQPYFPLDDERDSPRMINVLEVNMLTQDLVVVCPAEYGKQLVDSTLRHHGIAHFLFHPAHILKPDVAPTLTGLVDYVRQQNLEWWTSEQIHQWETLRRGVVATVESGVLTLKSPAAVPGATLLLLKTAQQPASIRLNQKETPGAEWTIHGFPFEAVPVDLQGSVSVQLG